MMFGVDKDSFENEATNIPDEADFLSRWREEGPLGTLCDILHHIRTPQQFEKIRLFQQRANDRLPVTGWKPLEIIKPVKTRWNSYVKAFRRAMYLREAIDAYQQYYIEEYKNEVATRRARRRGPSGPVLVDPDAPHWVKNGGLQAQDWQVVAQYIQYLTPLELATDRLQGHGKSRQYGAAWEVLPTFDAILGIYEAEKDRLGEVDYEAPYSPEDHYKIHVNLAWAKMKKYWTFLDEAPVYYAAARLHPHYKLYCTNAWADRPDWIATCEASLHNLWESYKYSSHPSPVRAPVRKKVKMLSTLEEQIESNTGVPSEEELRNRQEDELTRYLSEDPVSRDHMYTKDPFLYWQANQKRFPKLSRLAFDVLSTPASSADCERMFSELGDLLEPRRLKMNPGVVTALQCLKSWGRLEWAKSQTTTPEDNPEIDALAAGIEAMGD
jgi:hypothetical protein